MNLLMHPYLAKRLIEYDVWFKSHVHSNFPYPINSPYDMANAVNCNPLQITKSVVLQPTGSSRAKHCTVIVSANMRANLKVVAAAFRVTHLELAPRKYVEQLLSRPEIAIPLACGEIPIFMDSSLLQYKTIFVGAGIEGQEIEIAPADVVKVSGATVLSLMVSNLVFPEEVQSAFGPRKQL